jgi:hypothetical protein
MLRTLAILALAVLAVLPLTGCRRDPYANLVALAATPGTGRTAAANQIAADWKAGTLKLDPLIDHAFAMCEAARDQKPFGPKKVIPTSADATAFAGAVLNATAILEPQLPTMSEASVIFWMRVGGLAFIAAEEAHAADRIVEARSLVLAGAPRWQTDSYWYMHSGHDALAAVILAKSGEHQEAIRRLESRPELLGQTAEVYEMLKRGP